MKTFIGGFFTEYLNGIYKPSMNRLIALILILVIAFCGIYPVIKCTKDAIPLEFIGMLITLVGGLLGLSAYSKNIDIKSTTPNPNLPAPTQPPVQQ